MTNPQPDLVGVLGGMGPAATADFYTKLIRHTPATVDQEHLRVAIWADPTVPDRVGAVLGGSTDPYPALLGGARRLGSLGATLIAMPCHTAHFFLPRLATDTGLNFLDMIAETITELTRRRTHTVGLLATAATLHSQLYQHRLHAAGISTVLPTPKTQHDTEQAIRHVKYGQPQAARPYAARAAHALTDAGAELVVLACTELPLALTDPVPPDMPTILDPTDLLAQATVRAYQHHPP